MERTDEMLSDRYRLGRLLGTGGMGLVYLATDVVLERTVAVKILADNLAANDDARARFEREGQSAARVAHPNVVQVYDVGEQAGRPFIVMEFVDGPSLADLLEELGTIPAELVHKVAIDAAKGLAAAHRAGLLHRDVKPGNLLRTPDGRVKVTDFGIAETQELPGLTKTGMVLGTLAYLAPERARGAPASPQTDLYGLGATLYELLMGEPPALGSVGADHEAVLRKLAGCTDAPPALLFEVQRCLHPDPAERPVDGLALVAGLERTDAPALPTPKIDTQHTMVLPQVANEHELAGATRAMSPEEHNAPTPPDGIPILQDVGERSSRAAEGASRWWRARTHATRVALVIGAVATALVLGSSVPRGTDVPPADAGTEAPPAAGDPAADPAPEPAPEPGGDVPRSDDPLEQARQLADWLRSNS